MRDVTSLGSGHVTDCPAFLSVTVNDRTTGEELCRYDTLISCPPQFNITINVPPPPPSSSFSGDHRVFEVVLDDSKIEQRVYLSAFVVHDVEGGQHSGTFLARRVDECVQYGGKSVGLLVVFAAEISAFFLMYGLLLNYSKLFMSTNLS